LVFVHDAADGPPARELVEAVERHERSHDEQDTLELEAA
jgi:hypothetical protein